jgi:hypothetical protein
MLRSRLIDNIVESKFEHFQNHTIVKNKIDYDSLSLNPNITCNVIRNNLDKPWNWKYFTFHAHWVPLDQSIFLLNHISF